MTSRILYYPTIEFRKEHYPWLWSASLLWDKIYRIVPDGYELNEPRNIKELCETGDIGIPINPKTYSTQVAKDFTDKLEHCEWTASALNFHRDEVRNYQEYCKLHKDKVDVSLRNVFLANKDLSEEEDWLYVPQEMANFYMAYLSNRIAKENNLSLVTDSPDFWTASTFFQYENEMQDFYHKEFSKQALISLLIRDYIPKNIMHLTPYQIIRFREKRKDERRLLNETLNSIADELRNIKDPKIVREAVDEQRKKIEFSLNEYKKSMDIINISDWTGMISLFTTVAVDVMGYLGYTGNTIAPINTFGIGIGLISGIASHITRKQSSNDNAYSYLTSLDRLSSSGFENYNYILNRKIEEFIND
jgi:hypothetical protein